MTSLININKTTQKCDIYHLLFDSWNKSPIDTLKTIFHIRDKAFGLGFRKQFRFALKWLLDYHPDVLELNMKYIPLFGTYKDLLFFFGTKLESQMIDFYTLQLKTDVERLKENKNYPISLAAKYAPSEKQYYDRKFNATFLFAQRLGLNKAQYRKDILRPLRTKLDILETHMTSKIRDWQSIKIKNLTPQQQKKYEKCLEFRLGRKKMRPEKKRYYDDITSERYAMISL